MDTNKLYQMIIEQAPDAFIYADSTGVIRLWNDGALAVFGYSAMEALGKSLDLIVPTELRKAHWSGFELAIKTGQTKYVREILTTRSTHKNGNRIYVNLSFSVIKDENGNSIGAFAIGRDFTERYLEEKSLRRKVRGDAP